MGQSAFYRVIGGEGYDAGHDVVQVPSDSGFYVIGTSGSFQDGHSDAFLMKTTKEGWVEWSRNYGGVENEAGLSMEHVNNVGLYLMGRSNSSSGDYDGWLAFVDEQGNPQWERSYDNGNWEEIVASALTLNNDLIVGVNNWGENTNDQDVAIMRLNTSGDTVWIHEFDSPGFDEVTEIKSFQDSLFTVVSNRFDTVTNFHFAHLQLYHEDGNILWSDTLRLTGGDSYINDYFITNDTLFAIGAHKPMGGTPDNYYLRYRIGEVQHNLVSHTSIPSPPFFTGDVITNVLGSNFRYSGYYYNGSLTPAPGNDFYVALHEYTLGWQSVVGFTNTEGDDRVYAGIPTLDSGAVLVGYTALGAGSANICLIKIGPGFDYPAIQGAFGSQDLVNTEDLLLNAGVQVFPNPVETTLHVELSDQDAGSYRMTNLSGKIIASGLLSGTLDIDVSSVPSGIYLLELATSNGKAVNRIIVK